MPRANAWEGKTSRGSANSTPATLRGVAAQALASPPMGPGYPLKTHQNANFRQKHLSAETSSTSSRGFRQCRRVGRRLLPPSPNGYPVESQAEERVGSRQPPRRTRNPGRYSDDARLAATPAASFAWCPAARSSCAPSPVRCQAFGPVLSLAPATFSMRFSPESLVRSFDTCP